MPISEKAILDAVCLRCRQPAGRPVYQRHGWYCYHCHERSDVVQCPTCRQRAEGGYTQNVLEHLSRGEPARCPVCGGNGLVSNGFYNQTGGEWVTNSMVPEKCRSCAGTGVVWHRAEYVTEEKANEA